MNPEWLGTASTAISVALGVVALWKSLASGKAATKALLDAKAANDRAEEALAAATRFAEAMAGIHAAESARLEHEQAEREAPGILREWIWQAISDGRQSFGEFLGVMHSYPFRHEQIASLAELYAARLAANNPAVDGASPNPKLGEPFEMHVANPERA